MPIRWSQPAVNDLTAICDYLQRQESPALAHNVASAVYDAVQSLARFPKKARAGRVAGTRELVVQRYPYVIVYELRSNAVIVLRVLHCSQKWP